jgi:hypothetical protein
VIEMLVESITDTWTAQQVWGMSEMGKKEHKISIVYDYVSK